MKRNWQKKSGSGSIHSRPGQGGGIRLVLSGIRRQRKKRTEDKIHGRKGLWDEPQAELPGFSSKCSRKPQKSLEQQSKGMQLNDLPKSHSSKWQSQDCIWGLQSQWLAPAKETRWKVWGTASYRHWCKTRTGAVLTLVLIKILGASEPRLVLSKRSGCAINTLQLLLQDCNHPEENAGLTAAGKDVTNAV